VEEALRNYLNVEKLTGDNQYACPKCDKKQDGLKGSKFTKMPEILMLQLQRFTLDMVSLNRKKLNDEVSFPLYLNMNHFLDAEAVGSKEKLDQMVSENPLVLAKSMLKQTVKMAVAKSTQPNSDEPLKNQSQKNFEVSLENELGDTETTEENSNLSKGARLRMEKKIKEQEEH